MLLYVGFYLFFVTLPHPPPLHNLSLQQLHQPPVVNPCPPLVLVVKKGDMGHVGGAPTGGWDMNLTLKP